MKVKGKYRIEYENGFIQEKFLVEHEDYLNVVQPIRGIIGNLETNKGCAGAVGKLKSSLKDLFGDEYFTTESPLGLAIKTGKLALPPSQGGERKIKLKKIKS